MALTDAALGFALLAATGGSELANAVPTFAVVPNVVGDNFRTTESLYRVYRDADDFIASWPRNSDCDDACARSTIAEIDFSSDMLIVIAPRESGQETYDVAVTAVATGQGITYVRFLELRHGPPRDGLMCGVILTVPQPAVAILVPRTELPVRFLRRRADVICENETEVP
jgi:hypothetical protein